MNPLILLSLPFASKRELTHLLPPSPLASPFTEAKSPHRIKHLPSHWGQICSGSHGPTYVYSLVTFVLMPKIRSRHFTPKAPLSRVSSSLLSILLFRQQWKWTFSQIFPMFWTADISAYETRKNKPLLTHICQQVNNQILMISVPSPLINLLLPL